MFSSIKIYLLSIALGATSIGGISIIDISGSTTSSSSSFNFSVKSFDTSNKPNSNGFIYHSTSLYKPLIEGDYKYKYEWGFSYYGVDGLELRPVIGIYKYNQFNPNDIFLNSFGIYFSSYNNGLRFNVHYGESYNLQTIITDRYECNYTLVVGTLYEKEYRWYDYNSINVDSLYEPITINPLAYKSSPYIIENQFYYLNDKKFYESYLFSSYKDFVTSDKYNRLDIYDFKFVFDSSIAFKCDCIKLLIDDTENLFDGLNIDENGYRYTLLSFKENNKEVSIDFGSSLGVDPVTLKMYSDSRNHYKTKYFYMPKGYKETLLDYRFYILFEGMGVNKCNAKIKLTYSPDDYFISSCDGNGDYCVIGGIKE